MLDYEEFKQEIKDNIKDFLPEEYKDASVDIQTVTKNNGLELDGVMIRQPDENIAPNVYVNAMFEDYQAGRDMSDIMAEIADIRVENEPKHDFNVSNVINFDSIKDNIVPKLVNAEMNAEELAGRPHEMVDDLAVVYTVIVQNNDEGRASMPLTNELFEKYGISQEELHSVAMANMENFEKPTFKSMHDTMVDVMLGDMTASFGGDEEAARAYIEEMLPPEEVQMFVVSNEAKLNGAASMLDDKLMDQVTEQLGEDFFVIPSSIHECIVIPNDGSINVEDMTQMIQEVNATQVLPQERLSDHAYMYDSDQHQLVRADRSEEILQEAPEKEEKGMEAPKKEEKGVEIPENKEPEKKKDTITIKCGKGFVSEPFTAKDGKEYRQIKIPNRDENDKSPWASFVVKSNQIHENQYGKGMWLKLPENGNTTIRKDVKVGEKDGKGVYEKTETKISNKELKSMVEAYKTRSNEQDKEQTKSQEKGSSLQDRIANKKQKIEEKQKNEPVKEHSKSKENAL
jgi:hypothetical protein